MAEATYAIIRKGKTWTIDHDGTHEGDYATSRRLPSRHRATRSEVFDLIDE
jgi:hypothetical protein